MFPRTEREGDLEVLERRLHDGERRIEEDARAGADTDAWTEFWIDLLHQYEAVYRRLTESPQDERRSA